MSTNRLFIASAGSGKTTLIINDIVDKQSERVLITTFTIANAESIKERILRENKGLFPSNITVQTWFSFLLEHGVRPYRWWNKQVSGMQLVSAASAVYLGEENNFYQHYFNNDMSVYSDKISKLTCRCNDNSSGQVIKRLEKIYKHIYIDEVQDMAGWDYEILRMVMTSSINLTMVGDPRQAVYSTHPDRKYQKYNNGKVLDFIKGECKKIGCNIDEQSLNCTYRNSNEICALSSRLYPALPSCESKLKLTNSHMGVYFIKKKDVENYLSALDGIVQLRNDKRTKGIVPNFDVLNFGISKGLEFNHVLIFPTKPIMEWLKNNNAELKDKSCADLYVAITRAKFSVGFVVDDSFSMSIEGISFWDNNKTNI